MQSVRALVGECYRKYRVLHIPSDLFTATPQVSFVWKDRGEDTTNVGGANEMSDEQKPTLPDSETRDLEYPVIEQTAEPDHGSGVRGMAVVRCCIGLLNSMVRGGETHSESSCKAVCDALQYIDAIENAPTSPTPTERKELADGNNKGIDS